MAIIRYTKDENIRYAYLNIFPDQFKTETEKQDESWIKNTMDYFANKSYAEYVKNRDTFNKNYDLVKGILRREDFYDEPEVRSFTEVLEKDLELPKFVKHYSILTPPINTLVGEQAKRPSVHKAKAFDDESKSEQLEYKTQILQQYIIGKVKQEIIEQANANGEQMTDDEVEQLTLEKVKEYLDDYTTMAERWANHVLECSKVEFNMKEKAEECFRDLLISGREYFHVYEDNSKLGFNVTDENPKNIWFLTTPDRKYTSDVTGRQRGAYAAGTVKVMEISEIIEEIPELTKEEIDHLRVSLQDFGLINVRESNLFTKDVGINAIKYDTYDPLVLRTRMMIESEMKENNDSLRDFLGLTSNVSSFGYKYVVVRAYWQSKKKIGRVQFTDELGELQSMLVDENYKNKDIPTQVGKVEWGWINQWYQGLKIGPDIYHIKPFNLLNYCPIIGLNHEIKNTEVRSLVDLMKPMQMIYNVCMNQIWKLLEKEIGNVGVINIRRVPRVKDGDGQDDIDIWEMEARERGIMFDDDSLENAKGAVTNTSVARNVDLTRSNEIQSRYNLAIQIKNECWQLVGLNQERLGGSAGATQTATSINTAISQSYAQTEPLFAAHDYILNQLYQAVVDAALYVESKKPTSSISYITNEGENAFVEVNGTDLKLRDIKVFFTSRPEDQQMFNELRQLAQPLLQNGGSFYEVVELYSTNSVRTMKHIFRELKKKQDAMLEQQQQIEQQKIDEATKANQANLEQAEKHHQEDLAMRKYETDVKANTELGKAEISTYFKSPGTDANGNGIPDIMEIASHSLKIQESIQKRDLENKKLSQKMEELISDNKQRAEDRKVEREKMKNDMQIKTKQLAIAKTKAKQKPKSKS